MSERKGGGDQGGLDEEAVPGRGFVPDIVRRAVLTGVGALFMTEEGIRNLVGEVKLPKDALGFLLAQADRTRSEVARVVTQEVRRFLEGETLRREIWKLLTSVTLEVNATVQLKPSGQPGIKARIRRKKGGPGDAGKGAKDEHGEHEQAAPQERDASGRGSESGPASAGADEDPDADSEDSDP